MWAPLGSLASGIQGMGTGEFREWEGRREKCREETGQSQGRRRQARLAAPPHSGVHKSGRSQRGEVRC